MIDNYKTIHGNIEYKIEIRRSAFICNLKGIQDFTQGLNYTKEISKKYSNATHNCYALLTIDKRQKFFDDGEPGGTAGQPILQALKNKELNNVVAIVTRYFGGIKLGASGLINAYSTSVLRTIEKSQVVTKHLCKAASIDIEYNHLSGIESSLRAYKCCTLDTQYANSVRISFACPIKNLTKLEHKILSITAGQSTIEWQDKDYY